MLIPTKFPLSQFLLVAALQTLVLRTMEKSAQAKKKKFGIKKSNKVMKKTLLFALAAVATIFTSCSSDIINDNDDLNNGQSKGMTLIANVEQPDTRATLDTKETFGTWNFAYTDNDQVSVGNDKMENKYYTFTKSGVNFSCADAKATKQEVKWYAYYPSTNINLTEQAGTVESAAKLYALAGATTTATTGSDGLTINMAPKAAVLRIVKVDNYGPCDIFLKTTGDKFVKGLKAKKNEAGYEVETSESQVSVFKKESNGNAGIYYVIVPAGVYLEVWNDTKLIKKTKTNGLNAGKYYTLTSGPTTGTAIAKFSDGTTEKVEWVQMWIGGPRFATKNVAEYIAFKDDVKKGDNYVWGSLWCTPSFDDVKSIYNESYGLNSEILDAAYKYENGKHGFCLNGKQPGYTKNNMFIPPWGNSSKDGGDSKFLLSDKLNAGYGTSFHFMWRIDEGKIEFYIYEDGHDHDYTPYPVRPILNKETVLWGEQDIK